MALDDLETLTLLDKFFNLSWAADENSSEKYYKWEAFDEVGKLKHLWMWSCDRSRSI